MCVGGILAAEIFNKLNIADNYLCLFFFDFGSI